MQAPSLDMADAHCRSGLAILSSHGKPGVPAAQACFLEALRINESHCLTWMGMGHAFRDSGQHRLSIPCFKEAVRQLPGSSAAFLALSRGLLATGDLMEAAAALEQSELLGTTCIDTLVELAGAFYDRGSYMSAVKTYVKLLDVMPSGTFGLRAPELLNNLGNSLRGAARLREAKECYNSVCGLLVISELHRHQSNSYVDKSYNPSSHPQGDDTNNLPEACNSKLLPLGQMHQPGQCLYEISLARDSIELSRGRPDTRCKESCDDQFSVASNLWPWSYNLLRSSEWLWLSSLKLELSRHGILDREVPKEAPIEPALGTDHPSVGSFRSDMNGDDALLGVSGSEKCPDQFPAEESQPRLKLKDSDDILKDNCQVSQCDIEGASSKQAALPVNSLSGSDTDLPWVADLNNLLLQQQNNQVLNSDKATGPRISLDARLGPAISNLGDVLRLQIIMIMILAHDFSGRPPVISGLLPIVSSSSTHLAAAWCRLGAAFRDTASYENAVEAFGSALKLDASHAEAFAGWVHCRQCLCDWEDRELLLTRLQEQTCSELVAGRLPHLQPFHIMTLPFSAELTLEVAKRYSKEAVDRAQSQIPVLEYQTQDRPAIAPMVATGSLLVTNPGPGSLTIPATCTPLNPGLLPSVPLRVGYVSSDFGDHPLSHLMGSVFGLHNRSLVQPLCYSLSHDDGSIWRFVVGDLIRRKEVLNGVGNPYFVDLTGLSDWEAAERMRSDGIQIAIDLNGFTKGARTAIFALKPAPVQASLLGFPSSMGAPFIQYIFADNIVAPFKEGLSSEQQLHSQRQLLSDPEQFSEHIVRLPNSYFVNDYSRLYPEPRTRVGNHPLTYTPGNASYCIDAMTLSMRTKEGLPSNPSSVVYCCSNQLYKIDPSTFAMWCRVIQRVPNSVLWLLKFPPEGELRLRAAAESCGVLTASDQCRIVFSDVVPKLKHLERCGLADIYLDTPQCNAHTGAADSLWSGVPLLTLPGRRMASRVAASLAFATGLGHEMVVSSMKEYEERAVQLGLDHAMRTDLRQRLEKARLHCPLFDTAQWVGGFERALQLMWKSHCDGEGPRDIYSGEIDGNYESWRD